MTDEKILATVKPDGEYWQPELETMPREQPSPPAGKETEGYNQCMLEVSVL